MPLNNKGLTGLLFQYSSFISIIIINSIFFSGYYVLKAPLAYILHAEGMTLHDAYSINTSASTLLAISSIFFGLTLHNCAKIKFSLFMGLLFCVLSILLFSLKNQKLCMMAVSLYVLGGGLYFFNLIMYINEF